MFKGLFIFIVVLFAAPLVIPMLIFILCIIGNLLFQVSPMLLALALGLPVVLLIKHYLK